MMKSNTIKHEFEFKNEKNIVRTIMDRFSFVISKYYLSQMIRTLSEYVY